MPRMRGIVYQLPQSAHLCAAGTYQYRGYRCKIPKSCLGPNDRTRQDREASFAPKRFWSSCRKLTVFNDPFWFYILSNRAENLRKHLQAPRQHDPTHRRTRDDRHPPSQWEPVTNAHITNKSYAIDLVGVPHSDTCF